VYLDKHRTTNLYSRTSFNCIRKVFGSKHYKDTSYHDSGFWWCR